MGKSMTTETTETAFPAVLRAFRAKYGVSQQRLAERLQIARNTVKAWEHGDPRRQPHVLTREGVVARLTLYEVELHGSRVVNSPGQS
jgi:transcriptional regulator with XRE-family HTH domain